MTTKFIVVVPPDGRTTDACFSQWWPSEFTVDGVTYATAEPEDQFAFDGSFRLVIRSEGLLEGFVVMRIFEWLDNRLGSQSMANGILRRGLFAALRLQTVDNLRTSHRYGLSPVQNACKP